LQQLLTRLPQPVTGKGTNYNSMTVIDLLIKNLEELPTQDRDLILVHFSKKNNTPKKTKKKTNAGLKPQHASLVLLKGMILKNANVKVITN
jgi:hypothetical protein